MNNNVSFGARRLVIALAMLLAVAGVAKAQFRYGPTAALNISDLKFNQNIVNIDPHVGPAAGIQAEMMFRGIGFGLDLGLMYNQLGATAALGDKEIWASQGIKGKQAMTLHYIQLPLHLRFKWTRMNGFERKLAPFAFGGPEFNILAGHSKIEGTGGAKPIEFAGGDAGLTAGLGVELFQHWQVSGAYTWGMSYAVKSAQLDNWTADNRSWTIRVSYLF